MSNGEGPPRPHTQGHSLDKEGLEGNREEDGLEVHGGSPCAAELETVRRLFESSPHGVLIGLELVELGSGWVVARVAYRPELVGNSQTGYLHGGVITTLIDQCSGAAVMLATDGQERIVTLDLRIDHLRPAAPERDIYARAECYRVGREVAFARCVAYQDDPECPFATSMSAFMRLSEEAAHNG